MPHISHRSTHLICPCSLAFFLIWKRSNYFSCDVPPLNAPIFLLRLCLRYIDNAFFHTTLVWIFQVSKESGKRPKKKTNSDPSYPTFIVGGGTFCNLLGLVVHQTKRTCLHTFTKMSFKKFFCIPPPPSWGFAA